MHSAVSISGIPHLAKNERDMGHPPYVREEEADFCVRDWALLRADCRVFAKEERKSWKNAKKRVGNAEHLRARRQAEEPNVSRTPGGERLRPFPYKVSKLLRYHKP